jgi:hypothetical protein
VERNVTERATKTPFEFFSEGLKVVEQSPALTLSHGLCPPFNKIRFLSAKRVVGGCQVSTPRNCKTAVSRAS